MYKSFAIRNFRGFQKVELGSLKRVNLIIGKNNTGKTALLEALFIHVGGNNPELTLRVEAWRGIEQFPLNPEELWAWLFYGGQTEETIELTATGEDGDRIVLQMRLAESSTGSISTQKRNGELGRADNGLETTGPREARELVMEYKSGSGKPLRSRAFIANNEVKFERPPLHLPSGIFISTVRIVAQNAERFSRLELVGRHHEVERAVQIVEPRLKRLTILALGPSPIIHGDIGLEKLVPVPYMGAGMERLLSIVLAIHSAPGGFVLVDEIDNGLHHSVLRSVWRVVAFAARNANAQIFATTHSWECIKAAHETFEEEVPLAVLGQEEAYDFALHRLERVGEGTEAVSYDRNSLAAALKTELEVR